MKKREKKKLRRKRRKKKKDEKKEKKRKKNKKKKKKDIEEEQINEADLIGLDNGDEVIGSELNKNDDKNNQQNQKSNLNNDIFSIFNNQNTGPKTDLNASAHISQPDNGLFGLMDLTNPQPSTPSKIPTSIFENSNSFPTTKITPCYNQDNITIYSQFQRANGLLQLGLYFSEGGKNGATCNLSINKNSFGLICAPFSEIRDNIALFPMKNNMNNADRKPPSTPFVVNAQLQFNEKILNIKLIMNISVLFIENGKLTEKPFVEFYAKNQGQSFNNKIYTYPNYDSEEDIKNDLEKINILFSARQGTKSYFSANILGSMNFLLEVFIDNGVGNIKIIANNPSVVPLIKESIDSVLT